MLLVARRRLLANACSKHRLLAVCAHHSGQGAIVDQLWAEGARRTMGRQVQLPRTKLDVLSRQEDALKWPSLPPQLLQQL